MLLKSAIQNINNILSKAKTNGRNTLFEHEVYDILRQLQLEVPKYVFIEDGSLVDESILEGFIGSLVIKIVSPQIAHKQKVGGVAIIHDLQPYNVRDTLHRMKQEVLSHFSAEEKPDIKGFLLVEFIHFTPSLGVEVLFGFKQDHAFGPVLTLSKGGDDAEFFAKYYDPANLIIPPLDIQSAFQDISSTLNIRHKFSTQEHAEYLHHLAEVLSGLSYLAYTYSNIADEQQEYVINTMDINPFVMAKDNRFVAVDGFAEFEPAIKTPYLPDIRIEHLNEFFRPKGIAVVGVSTDMGKYSLGREIARLLRNLGRDDLYFINVKGGTIAFEGKEYPLYKSLGDIPTEFDLVVYAAPAPLLLELAGDLSKSSAKAVILISGIPSDINYHEFKEKLSSILPKHIRVIGPNCMGVFYAPDEKGKGLNTLFIDEKRLEIKSLYSSNTALLTQSGALAVTIIDRLNNSHPLKAVVSFGNKYDVNPIDLIAYFAQEKSVEVIALYVEGLDAGEGRMLFEQAKSISKPLIVYKSGKTEAGARAAASHTASMSGSYEVFKAACRQAGMILAEKIEDFEDYIKAFSLLAHKKPAGNRIAGVFNAGFESTIGADELSTLKQAQLTAETVEKLRKADRYGLVDLSTSFLDITPMADDRMYASFIEAVMQDENVDCVYVAIVPHSNALKSLPESCHDADSLASLLSQLSKQYNKPIAVSVNAGSRYIEFTSIMEKSGLPVYHDVRSALKSLDRFVSYHMAHLNQSI